ncbi:MAG: GntR family transcriptional regulator [Propionibacteriaceae bacterium]|jgi:DNA-binding GntR family transcriptional regulator|nr:GntR family transcriptional regulator [Propionibacteriaceae bacterium]
MSETANPLLGTRSGAPSRKQPNLRPAIRWAMRDTVHEAILEMLLVEHLEPGAPLRIDAIAKSLDVSPTPVREALVEIEATGLITRTALKGYRVAEPLSHEEFSKLMNVRILLEPVAAHSACDAYGGALTDELIAVLDRQRGAAVIGIHTDDGLRGYLRADIEFHDVILNNCQNSFLKRAVQSMGGHFHRFRDLYQGRSDSDFALAEHQHIVDAFAAGDSDAAEGAMLNHHNAVAGRVKELGE